MIKAQRGTHDIFEDEILTWQWIEETAGKVFKRANFSKIETPIFEATELFARGVGDSTDIVNKEMYTFKIGKNDTSITLRPENTAGVVRCFIEHNFERLSPPVKLWYFGQMFRYERPQAGRQRQFHQLGVEMFQVEKPSADAEIIALALELLRNLGVDNLEVEINSLGCKNCKNKYTELLKAALKPELNNLCDDCKIRYEKNPLRILDCKNENCQKIFEKEGVKSAILGDFICPDCKSHFDEVLGYLDTLKIPYKINKRLVRGLDYYNRTVFEVKSAQLGAQSAILGGGRYDSLTETLGGPKVPAIGFAIGVERLYSIVKKIEKEKLDFYIVSNNLKSALHTAIELRRLGKTVDFDYQNRKFSKQLEKAAKCANFALILGEDEIKEGFFSVKNLLTGEQVRVENIEGLCGL